MMSSNKMFSVLALVAPFAVGAVMASPVTTVSEAQAGGLPNFCESTRGICEFTSIYGAPELDMNVCWNGTALTLMGGNGCGLGKQAYYLAYGIVADPITNIVIPFSPLKDTCDLGYCMPNQLDAGTIVTDGVACCNPDTDECSSPDANGICEFGDITWCETLEDNGDGTVTCHED